MHAGAAHIGGPAAPAGAAAAQPGRGHDAPVQGCRLPAAHVGGQVTPPLLPSPLLLPWLRPTRWQLDVPASRGAGMRHTMTLGLRAACRELGSCQAHLAASCGPAGPCLCAASALHCRAWRDPGLGTRAAVCSTSAAASFLGGWQGGLAGQARGHRQHAAGRTPAACRCRARPASARRTRSASRLRAGTSTRSPWTTWSASAPARTRLAP